MNQDIDKESTIIRDRRQYLLSNMKEYHIPVYMHLGLLNYIIDGIPVGSFLTAVLENNLLKAVRNGDDANQRALHSYVNFLYNHAPNGCFGKEGVMQHWKERGGLRGIIEHAVSEPIMNFWKAVETARALLNRDADCRCGNHTITDEEKEAIERLIKSKANEVSHG